MTFRSAWISLDDGTRPEGAVLAKGTLSIPISSPHATLRALSGWAKNEGVPISYVDNSWIYCRLDRQQLERLLPNWLGGGSDEFEGLLSLLAQNFGPDHEGPFFVDAEEF